MIEALKDHDGEEPVINLAVKDFAVLSPSDKLNKIYPTILMNEAGFYPVVEDGKVVGVIDRESINQFLMMQSSLN